jgi:hypothetical protein
MPLPQLVANRFCKLSLAEEKLVNAAANGETADCRDLCGCDKDVRGELLSWLCTNPQATAQVTYRGIAVVGAEFVKEVDLKWAKISFPIAALNCLFRETIDLSHSQVAFLTLEGSSLKDLNAQGAHFESDLYLREGLKAEGGVVLLGAKIDGVLDCAGGQFIGKGKAPALYGNSVEVKGSVLLGNDFQSRGEVDLAAAKINGSLDCVGGQFIANGKESAFFARNIVVKGSVLLRNGVAKGGIDLLRARINGNLECDGSQFVAEGETPALRGCLKSPGRS